MGPLLMVHEVSEAGGGCVCTFLHDPPERLSLPALASVSAASLHLMSQA